MSVDLADLVRVRADQPGLVAEMAAARALPDSLVGSTGRLMLRCTVRPLVSTRASSAPLTSSRTSCCWEPSTARS